MKKYELLGKYERHDRKKQILKRYFQLEKHYTEQLSTYDNVQKLSTRNNINMCFSLVMCKI